METVRRGVAARSMAETPTFADGGVVKRLANGPDEEQQKQMGYSEQMRNVGSALASAPIEAAKTLVSAPGYGINKESVAPVVPAAQPVAAPVQSQVTPGVSPTGGITTPSAPATPVQPAVAALATPTTPNNQVTRTGNSYTGAPNITGDISINGSKGGGISPQNQQAAQALSDKYSASSRMAAPAIEAGGVNYGTGGSTYTQDLARKNAETGASSIFNTGSRQTARDQLKAMDAQALSNIGAQSSQTIAKMQGDNSLARERINADTQRVGYGITAQNNQATQQNAAARLGIDRTTAGLANQATQQKIASDKQMQDLQTQIISAKTPEEKAAAEDAYMTITKSQKFDKNNDKRFVKLTNKDGTTNDTTDRLFDTEKMQFVGDTPKQVAPLPNHVEALRKDPKLAANFDKTYGAGASLKILGTK